MHVANPSVAHETLVSYNLPAGSESGACPAKLAALTSMDFRICRWVLNVNSGHAMLLQIGQNRVSGYQ